MAGGGGREGAALYTVLYTVLYSTLHYTLALYVHLQTTTTSLTSTAILTPRATLFIILMNSHYNAGNSTDLPLNSGPEILLKIYT